MGTVVSAAVTGFIISICLAVPCSMWLLSSLTKKGSTQHPLHWQHGVLTTGPPGPPGKSQHAFVIYLLFGGSESKLVGGRR